ncbi:MAG: histidine phosphatase family protein [Saprospiraceae bacterium]|nr:histidine phosphatase family protein [Saprospiraceae bacterium]
MLNIRQLAFLILGLTVLLPACRDKATKEDRDYRDSYIQSIVSGVVNLESGEQIRLDADSLTKVYYLIRHAEKDTSVQDNPPLTEAGLQRAARLSDILKGTRVDAIYSTMFIRTLYTVDSLADIKSMKVQPYDNKMLKELISQLNENPEIRSVLMVGHSNTIPSITNTLAGKEVYNQAFGDEDYDNFAIVAIYSGGTRKAYPLRFK